MKWLCFGKSFMLVQKVKFTSPLLDTLICHLWLQQNPKAYKNQIWLWRFILSESPSSKNRHKSATLNAVIWMISESFARTAFPNVKLMTVRRIDAWDALLNNIDS